MTSERLSDEGATDLSTPTTPSVAALAALPVVWLQSKVWIAFLPALSGREHLFLPLPLFKRLGNYDS